MVLTSCHQVQVIAILCSLVAVLRLMTWVWCRTHLATWWVWPVLFVKTCWLNDHTKATVATQDSHAVFSSSACPPILRSALCYHAMLLMTQWQVAYALLLPLLLLWSTVCTILIAQGLRINCRWHINLQPLLDRRYRSDRSVLLYSSALHLPAVSSIMVFDTGWG